MTRPHILMIIWIILNILPFSLFGQNSTRQVTRQQLIWFAYFTRLEIHPKWFVVSEVQERRFYKPHRQHQFLVRGHIHYKIDNKWDAGGGFTYFLQSPQAPTVKSNFVVPELRPHVQLDYRQQFRKRIMIVHRYRAERRFFRNTLNERLAEGYHSNFRFRYRLGIDFLLFDIDDKPFIFKVSNETHLNAGRNIIYNHFDQNRLYVGVNCAVTKNISIEAGYLKWYQQRPSGIDFFDRDIVRFIVAHKIDARKVVPGN